MKAEKNFSEKRKKIWISLTGYRTLLILKLLIEKSRTANEIINILKNNKITNKSVSKDTVRLTINTLKAAGCKISRPSRTNGYTYVLKSHPFALNLTDEEFSVIMKMRNETALNLHWEKVFILNDLYEKIMQVSASEEKINYNADTKPFPNIDINFIKKFEEYIASSRKVQIRYNSPKNGDEDIDIIPEKISYENGMLYLIAYSFKYNEKSLFSFERIKAINSVYLFSSHEKENTYEVVYKVTGNFVYTFEKKDYETIIERKNNAIIVKAVVDNEFCFMQRVLSFGTDFKIISPSFFREKLINKIKQIQKGYENE